MSISRYFTEMLDPSMTWDDVADMVKLWSGPFCLKGIMSVEDARHAVDIGCSGIVLSNHGGRQLDGSRAAFDQLAEIVDAVGGRIEVICDGGVRRGTHVLKALSVGATACSGGRMYLYALAAAGQLGVETALGNLRAEIDIFLGPLSGYSRVIKDRWSKPGWAPMAQILPLAVIVANTGKPGSACRLAVWRCPRVLWKAMSSTMPGVASVTWSR